MIKRKKIVSSLLLSGSLMGTIVSNDTHIPEHISIDSAEKLYLVRTPIQSESTKKVKPLVGVTLGAVAASLVAYKKSKTVQDTVDSSYDYVKFSVLPSLLLKVEKLKDEGIKKEDALKIGCALGACYGVKKLWDFFHIKELIKGDASHTKEALARCKKESGTIIAGLGITSAVGYLCWLISKEPHLFDRLKLSFKQRQDCSQSKELSALLHEGNISEVLSHNHLISVLTPDQSALRQSLMKEYQPVLSWEDLLEEMD